MFRRGTNPDDLLLGFYRGENPDIAGRMIDQIWAYDFSMLEMRHDYIQWLFPLETPSSANFDAPVLNDAQIQEFRTDPELQARLLESFTLMLRFYGLKYLKEGDQPVITRSDAWPVRKQNWLTPYNHNYLRITRMLTSLRTLGLEAEADAFFKALQEIYNSPDGRPIGNRSYNFWRDAVTH